MSWETSRGVKEGQITGQTMVGGEGERDAVKTGNLSSKAGGMKLYCTCNNLKGVPVMKN